MRDQTTSQDGSGRETEPAAAAARSEYGGGAEACPSKPLDPRRGTAGWFALQLGLNRQTRELHVCMTRAVAGVSVAGFCGLLIGVVAVSRSVSDNGPQTARAGSSIIDPAAEEGVPRRPAAAIAPREHTKLSAAASASRRAAPAVAGPARSAAVGTSGSAAPKAAAAVPTTSVTPEPLKDPAAATGPAAAAAATTHEGRTAGQNYLVFGSYPTHAEARRELERLKREGVSCTIERSLAGWTKKGWYSVVGTKGFESTKAGSYQAEVKALSAQGFSPRGYRWRGTSGGA